MELIECIDFWWTWGGKFEGLGWRNWGETGMNYFEWRKKDDETRMKAFEEMKNDDLNDLKDLIGGTMKMGEWFEVLEWRNWKTSLKELKDLEWVYWSALTKGIGLVLKDLKELTGFWFEGLEWKGSGFIWTSSRTWVKGLDNLKDLSEGFEWFEGLEWRIWRAWVKGLGDLKDLSEGFERLDWRTWVK